MFYLYSLNTENVVPPRSHNPDTGAKSYAS